MLFVAVTPLLKDYYRDQNKADYFEKPTTGEEENI